MWIRSHTNVFKGVKKEEIWDLWKNVNRWHEWVPGVEFCRLEKPFRAGSDFTLKPKDASVVKVQLIEVEEDRKFTGCTQFFGATLYNTYEVQTEPDGTRLTVTLKVIGPLGFVWRKLVAEKIDAKLPKLMRNLAGLAGVSSVKKSQLEGGGPIMQHVKSRTSTTKLKAAPKKANPKAKSSTSSVKKAKPKVSAAKTAVKKITATKKTSTVKKAKPKSTVKPTKK